MASSQNIRASLYMMLSMFGFTVNDVLIKTLDGALPSSQIMWLRGVLLSGLIVFIAWRQGIHKRWREAATLPVFLRASADGVATLFFLAALVRLPFANISAILQSLALAVTLGAALFLGEPVGWRRWLAIVIGFSGVLLIIRPGMDGFDSASLLVLVAVVFAAARDLVTRQLPASLPSTLISGATALLITFMGLVLTLAQSSWQPVSLHQWLVLTAAAAFLFFGYQFIVLGMRIGEVAYVMPFRYTSLLWAIIFAYIIFNEVPDGLTLAGSAIVVAMGLFTLYRERIRGQDSVS